jgi:4'-phosphopantetheinyl transferase
VKVIYPVILAVPEEDRLLRGRDKVLRLSRLARRSVHLSADYSGIRLGELIKSPNGVPLPVGGCFWSLAHKNEYVAGVVADFPIGMDIEKIRPCLPGLYRMLADETEWKLAEMQSERLFFRYWTAKETVLKSVGIGLSGLSVCHIVRIVDDQHMVLSYKEQVYYVEHFYFNDHIAAVIDHPDIRWVIQQATRQL